MEKAYISSFIYYCFVAERAGAFALPLPVEETDTACQHSLRGGLSMSWLRIRWYLRQYPNGEQMWWPFVESAFSQLVSLTEIQSWIRCRPRQGAWLLQYLQSITALGQSGNVVGGTSTLGFYRWLMEVKCNDVLGEVLVVTGSQLAGVYQITFLSKTMNSFRSPWPCSATGRSDRFEISSTGTGGQLVVRDAHRTRKPFCMLSYSFNALMNCGVLSNCNCHV